VWHAYLGLFNGKHCNSGNGNGNEGCDPGKSSPQNKGGDEINPAPLGNLEGPCVPGNVPDAQGASLANPGGNNVFCSPPLVKVEKPWGGFEQYAHNVPCTVKTITVEPGGILSSQYHHHRDELWVILDLGAKVELEEKVLFPSPGEKLYIPRGMVHRLSCTGERSVRVLEVSFGEFAEDDIVRLEDLYGRVDL
jgi:mannose-6-phosphate isomerase